MASLKDRLVDLAERMREARLGDLGFDRRGTSLWRKYGDNFGLILVEPSKHSTAEHIRIRATLGVESAILRRFLGKGGVRRTRPPRLSECHWWEPIGHFMSVRQDFWWVLPESNPQEVEAEFCAAVCECGVLALEEHTSDRELLRIWKAGNYGVSEDVERLRNVALLGAGIGDSEAIRFALDELERFSASDYRWAWRAKTMREELIETLASMGMAGEIPDAD